MTQPNLYCGTSGWAYPTWKPGFYPQKLGTRKFLEHYASRLNTVEVNYTFRTLPEEAQLQGWLDATTRDFRFSFKVPQRITHMRRLRECGDPLTEFLLALKPVVKAAKQGALLFQFPPNFRATALGKDKQPNQQALALFLKQHGKLLRKSKWRVAVEFRDASWFSDTTYALLRRTGIALCQAESADLVTPLVATANFTYARMRATRYTESRLISLSERFRGPASGQDAFVYFKHEDAPDGPLRAEKLLHYQPR